MPASSKSDSVRTTAQTFDFGRIQVLTFDCYGTLIDWETGILSVLRPLVASHGHKLEDTRILQIYGDLEPKAQNPYHRYRDVLFTVAKGFGDRLGFSLSDAEAQSLPESLKNWQPFPDTVAALTRLQSKYKLAIISNTDDDLFGGTARHLKVPFDQVITAEQAKAYKPSLAPFQLALQRLGVAREHILHVGQSIYHDVQPAKSLGINSALVYRRGFGATRRAEGAPDLTVPDLETLASLAV